MKKQHYLTILSLLFLFGCSSDDDINPQPEPEPDPDPETEIPVEEGVYEIPAALTAYYEAVDFSLEGEELLQEVATLSISKHSNFLDYGQRHNYLYEADADPDNENNVLLIYSGESRDKREYLSGGNSHDPQTFNTEHVFPQSKVGNTAKGDLHHLKPADIDINSSRGNYPFTDGEGTYKVVGGNSFYPGDDWKGDIARMIMYMHLRYDEPFEEVGDLELFVEWNVEDPVSEIEIQRNNIIEDAQGNRNPFIDNPHIATRIWGGEDAQNRWDGTEEPEETDEEAPSVPTDLVAEASFESVTLTWEASTDNDRVARYEVFVDGDSYEKVSATTSTVTELTPGSTYSFTVVAIDASGNTSEASEALEVTTLEDTEAPGIPTGLAVTAATASSISLSWTASTDNSEVKEYDLYVNSEFHSSVNITEVNVTGLEAETTYTFAVLARDIYNNESELSAELEATTAEEGDEDEGDGNPGTASDLFFSEYVEGGAHNKAVEIVNLTGAEVDLGVYSIKKIVNGAGEWQNELKLEGVLGQGEVFVAAHSSSAQEILDAANVTKGSGPLDFNGNDPVGLFKNGELIDMIGFTGGDDYAKDVTLRRKASVTGPSATYSIEEWEELAKDTFDGLGTY